MQTDMNVTDEEINMKYVSRQSVLGITIGFVIGHIIIGILSKDYFSILERSFYTLAMGIIIFSFATSIDFDKKPVSENVYDKILFK